MNAYRDQYAQIFKNGRNVVLIAISADPDTALYSWARDAEFPFLFASDTGAAVGLTYGAFWSRAAVSTTATCSWWDRTARSRTARRRSGRSIPPRTGK